MGDTFNGELAYVFLVSIVDAAVLSWIALRWYRRSVSRIMQRPPGLPEPLDHDEPPADAAAAARDPLRMGVVEASRVPTTALAQSLPASVWQRVAIAYGTGALLYSAVMSAAVVATIWPLNITAIASQVWVHTWPMLPALIALLVLDRKRAFALIGLFVGLGAVSVAIVGMASQTLRGAEITSPFANAFSAIASLVQLTYVPLFLIAITGWRRIRAVTGLALAATLFFGFGLFSFHRLFAYSFNVNALKSVMLDAAVITSHQTVYYGTFMLLSLPFGWLAWRAFNGLASAYERHAFSDVQLIVDCWVVVVAAEVTATHLAASFGLAAVAMGLAAFAAYRTGVAVMLGARPLPSVPGVARNRLLLLRVFGYQARTESLFDHIAQRWRFRGPVQLIAGTDLAMRTVDPGDMLAFISGRLRDQYVSSVDEVPERVAHLDMNCDPDGRFRINELYCLHDTWQPTIQALLAMTDVIVMDLRGFTKDRKGAQFELQHIVTRIPTDRIVLISDKTTDEPLVEQLLQSAWAQAGASTTATQNGQLDLIRVESNSRRELDGVMGRLLGHGELQQVQDLSASPA